MTQQFRDKGSINKKSYSVIVISFVLSPVFAELKISGTITVAEPVLKNTGEDESWISYFVQGRSSLIFKNTVRFL